MYMTKGDSLPQFFITGTVKGGTTALYNYLLEHPDIYMSPVKEPHFFCTDIDPVNFREQYKKMIQVDVEEFLKGEVKEKWVNTAFIRDEKVYRRLFANAKISQVRGESSTSYLISTEAAQNIYKLIPEAKIIIMLRDPVERAYSHYLMNYRSGSVTSNFQMELERDIGAHPKGWGITRMFADHGFYYEPVKRYIDIFGHDQVMIILNEDLSDDTGDTVRAIYKFLGVDQDYTAGFHQRHNSASIPTSGLSRFLLRQNSLIKLASLVVPRQIRNAIYRNLLVTGNVPEISMQSRKYLNDLYRDDVQKLQQLIGRDLSHWLK